MLMSSLRHSPPGAQGVAQVGKRAWAEGISSQRPLLRERCVLPALSNSQSTCRTTSVNGKLVPGEYEGQECTFDTNRASLTGLLSSQCRTDRQSQGTPGGDVACQSQQEYPSSPSLHRPSPEEDRDRPSASQGHHKSLWRGILFRW